MNSLLIAHFIDHVYQDIFFGGIVYVDIVVSRRNARVTD
jgi:hypothetical protein